MVGMKGIRLLQKMSKLFDAVSLVDADRRAACCARNNRRTPTSGRSRQENCVALCDQQRADCDWRCSKRARTLGGAVQLQN